jgi:hypothetical protein
VSQSTRQMAHQGSGQFDQPFGDARGIHEIRGQQKKWHRQHRETPSFVSQ